eukprot:9082223-Lingulodinium_polyedra.AAC.1
MECNCSSEAARQQPPFACFPPQPSLQRSKAPAMAPSSPGAAAAAVAAWRFGERTPGCAGILIRTGRTRSTRRTPGACRRHDD